MSISVRTIIEENDMTYKEFENRLKVMAARAKKADNDIPVVLKGTCIKLWLGNFNNEGFFGSHWRQVQRRIPGTKTWKYIKPVTLRNHKILTGLNANLMKAVANSCVRCDKNVIHFIVNSEYGIYHHKGTPKMSKRQFLGDHPILHSAIRKIIREHYNKVLFVSKVLLFFIFHFSFFIHL